MQSSEKATVLEQLESQRAEIDRLLVEVGVDRMTQPIAGSWSVKDIVAHFMAYDRWWSAQIRSTMRGTPATIRELHGSDEPLAGSDPFDLDHLNASIYDRYKDWPLDDVLQGAQAAFVDLCSALQDTPDALWNAPLEVDWAMGDMLPDLIRQQIIDHYRAHEPQLRSWIMQDEGLASGPDEQVEA
jgi:hypothetical protein